MACNHILIRLILTSGGVHKEAREYYGIDFRTMRKLSMFFDVSVVFFHVLKA